MMAKSQRVYLREIQPYFYGGPADGDYGPHGLWYEKHGEHFTKYDRPYSYSPFFLFGDHESIKDADCDYTDRYQLWDQDRYKRALAAIGKQCRWDQMSPADYQRFVASYYGKDAKVVGVVEWCNVSNGYPCWSIHFTKPEPANA